METEVKVSIKSRFIQAYKNGYPLIPREALIEPDILDTEGVLLRLVDEQNRFIGRGYYGKQNKGCGFILTFKEEEPIDPPFFDQRLAAALTRRRSYYEDEQTTAFRVFNGEGDGIGGFTIDHYDGYYLVQWYSKGIYRFREPVLQALQKQVAYKAIYQKKRFASEGKYVEEDDFVTGEPGTFPILVKENGVNVAVSLNDGAMTGVFLDQREVRKKIRDRYAQGKTVLNTFSYTGVFSVFAALGGAVKTTNVDLANRSRDKTVEQFEANGLDASTQDIIVEDVFRYFKYAVRKGLEFDLVILDPPSFARSKKVVFSVTKDYKDLLKQAIAVTADSGIIVASTNSSALSRRQFHGFIQTAFHEMNEPYRIVEEFSLPDDFATNPAFPEGNYLKVAFCQKQKGSPVL